MTGSAKLRGVSALPESTAGKRNRRGCRGGTGQSRPGRTARTRRDSDTGGNHSLLTFSGRAGQTLERHSQNTAKHRA